MADGQDDIVDPTTGLFNAHQVYRSPGPGGPGSPLGGILDFMNAFKGQDLANQAQQERRLHDLNTIQTMAQHGGMDLSQNPELSSIGAGMGFSPDTLAQVSASTPNARIQSELGALQAANPGQPLDPQAVADIYLKHAGEVPPSIVSSLTRATARDKTVYEQNKAKADQLMGNLMRTLVNQGAPEDQIFMRLSNMANGLASLRPEDRDEMVMRYLEQARIASSQATPKATAQVGEITAKGHLEEERAETLHALRDPQLQELAAKTGLENSRKAYEDVATKLAELKLGAGGVMPAAQVLELDKLIAANDRKVAGIEAAGAQPGVDPVLTRQAVAKMKEISAGLKQQLSNIGGQKKTYKDVEEFKKAFEEKVGRPPSAAEIEKAKGKYY